MAHADPLGATSLRLRHDPDVATLVGTGRDARIGASVKGWPEGAYGVRLALAGGSANAELEAVSLYRARVDVFCYAARYELAQELAQAVLDALVPTDGRPHGFVERDTVVYLYHVEQYPRSHDDRQAPGRPCYWLTVLALTQRVALSEALS
jgi:hypothetical protein